MNMLQQTMAFIACVGTVAAGVEPGHAPVKPDQLPIRAITLYRSGVANMQRRGTVEGDSTVAFRFDTDQINDILKSMVVLDLSGKGRVANIGYGSRDPLTKRLSSFGVNIADEPTLPALLSRLRGAAVAVTTAEGQRRGTILSVENRQEGAGQGPVVAVAFLNIVTEEGIRSFGVPQILSIEVLDEPLAAELRRALGAVAEHRADRTKTVDVVLEGEGSREIAVSYVQEAPVWKVSYRLVLGDGAAAKDTMAMHGWAIIENTTDEDWNAVSLALVSGRPVGFRMDLYQPMYVSRPMVPVPTVPGVTSRVFESGTDVDRASADQGGVALQDKMAAAPPAAPGFADARFREGEGKFMFQRGGLARPGAPAGQARQVESGEVFQFELDHPVSIERQRSAMLPIINAPIGGRRVSIFSTSDAGSIPMRGLELTNSTGLQLLPGPISVYDGGAYAGDAQIGHIPPGDRRLLAYSMDLSMEAHRESHVVENVRKARIAKGLLETTLLSRNVTDASFQNKDRARARTVIVEHPRSGGWELKEPAAAKEQTESLYRFEVDVASGGNNKLRIVEERVQVAQVGLESVDPGTMLAYRTDGAISQGVLDAFKEAQRRRGAIEDVKRRIAEAEKERNAIAGDQNRIRQNMNSIERNSELYQTYMQKLTAQESRVDAIAKQMEKDQAEEASLQASYSEFLANLNIE